MEVFVIRFGPGNAKSLSRRISLGLVGARLGERESADKVEYLKVFEIITFLLREIYFPSKLGLDVNLCLGKSI